MIQQAVQHIATKGKTTAVTHVTVWYPCCLQRSDLPTNHRQIGTFSRWCLLITVLCAAMYWGIWYIPSYPWGSVHLWISPCRPRWLRKVAQGCCISSCRRRLSVEDCEQQGLCTQGSGLTRLAGVEGPIHPYWFSIQDIPGPETSGATVRDRYTPHLELPYSNFPPLWVVIDSCRGWYIRLTMI